MSSNEKDPKKNFIKAMEQIYFACDGGTEAYKETIEALCAAVNVYITQLTITAASLSKSHSKIEPSDIVESLRDGSDLRDYAEKFLEDITKKKEFES